MANYDHWLWGENNLGEDNPEYLINLEIGVSIRFNSSIAMYTDYEEFYNGITDKFILIRNSLVKKAENTINNL